MHPVVARGGSSVQGVLVCAEDFDSFAALIRATKERDAARRAKQQQSQAALPQSAAYDAGPKAEAAARAALPQANEQRSDMDATVVAAEGSCQPVKSETRLAACPVRVLPSGQLKVALPSESGTCLARLNSQDADGEAPWNISSVQVGAANSALMVPNDRQPGIQHGPAEAQYRVDLTLGDTPSKLSQESLAVEVDDDASPVSSQKVQDQRALQQLQLLNNSTEPVSVSSACNRKSIQLSQDKEHAVFSAPHQSVVAHLGRNEDRNDNCLGPLDDIIDDTDSDLEGLMQ